MSESQVMNLEGTLIIESFNMNQVYVIKISFNMSTVGAEVQCELCKTLWLITLPSEH